MKKRNMAALALLAVMLLTACGRAADAAVTTGNVIKRYAGEFSGIFIGGRI